MFTSSKLKLVKAMSSAGHKPLEAAKMFLIALKFGAAFYMQFLFKLSVVIDST